MKNFTMSKKVADENKILNFFNFFEYVLSV